MTEKPDRTLGWYDGEGISRVEACFYLESSEQVFASIRRVLNELGWPITAESERHCALSAAVAWKPNKVLALVQLDVDGEVDLRVLDEPGGGSVVHVAAHTGEVIGAPPGARPAVRAVVRRFLDALDRTLM